MRRRSGSWRPVAIWAIVILVVTSIPVADIAQRMPLPWLDKVVHAAMYAVLGWFVGTALWVSGRRGPLAFVLALAAMAAFAALDEIHQRWLPGRVPMLSDWLADLVGATIGLVAGMMLMRTVAPGGPEDA